MGESGEVGSPVANPHSPGWPLEGACSLFLCGSLQSFSCLSLSLPVSLCLYLPLPLQIDIFLSLVGQVHRVRGPACISGGQALASCHSPPKRGAQLPSGSSHVHSHVCYVGSCHSCRKFSLYSQGHVTWQSRCPLLLLGPCWCL